MMRNMYDPEERPDPGYGIDRNHPIPPEDAWIESLVHLLDSRFRIPGTGIRFGLDSLLGLIPGAGDTAGLFLAGIVLFVAASKGVGGRTLAFMAGNILLDYAVGSVPVLGDIFDVAFKANHRNLRILRRELRGERERKPRPWVTAVVLLLLILLVSASIILTALGIRAAAAFFRAGG